jgi:hypothetical protein
MRFSKRASVERTSHILFGAETAKVVEFWFSQWPGEERLPLWAKFALRDLGGARNAAAVHEIKPDGRFHCHEWGPLLAKGTGVDLTGKNVLDYTAAEMLETRRKRYTAVADGHIGHALKEGTHASGLKEMAEEIMLPFGDTGEDGSRFLLYHVNWRPSSYDLPKPQITNAFDVAIEFDLIPLSPMESA